jgi:hypothetical protein
VRRDKSQYALAREPYKQLHPQAKMHHLVPTSRDGCDSEFNLFPWNEKSHIAWHRLFCIMSVREVWPVLADVHMLVFQSEADKLVREWCLPYRYHGKKAEQRDMCTPQTIGELRDAWVACFGGTDLKSAQRLVRYMMLYMVLGRHADHSVLVYETSALQAILGDVEGSPERFWAFRQCFGRMPRRVGLRPLKKTIRRVRAFARSIPIH